MRRSRTVVRVALLLGVTRAALARPIESEQIAKARDEVFERPEFQYAESNARSNLADVLDALAEALFAIREQYPVAFMIALVLMVLTLVVLVAHIIWTVRAARRAEYDYDDVGDPELLLERTGATLFRERALHQAAAGRFEEAVRDLYMALVLTLDQRGIVHYASHKALLDYRVEAASDETARAALDRFGGVYLPTSFGRRPLDEEHFAELVATLDGVSE